MEYYQVFYENRVIGQAEVISEGLYYRFRCKCVLPTKDVYRLMLSVLEQQYDLGICVPDGATCVAEKRIPIKRIPTGEMVFSVLRNTEHTNGIQLSEDRPFPHIKSLINAKLQVKNGACEIFMQQNDPGV